ncbi:hypothetical protein [Pontibacter cellulosilyticus]|uniref:Uncharacterized protein n=1 Tax=Pontibacter cellulosilyticus TaxID=1720253 RepID=A0A923N8G2_9BACT|nr:hypothetical protein [Pontibacter cellulosilyticus]MBC5994830.1 hypothetical protein [Pontibacter cellulosilyticus]
MKYNLAISRKATSALSLQPVLVATAALGCAFLVETVDLNRIHPLQLLLESAVADASIVINHCTK